MMNELEPTVFVVDDDESMRRALSYLLTSAGYRAEIFASAEEFLARKCGDEPGCIILDVRMPGLNGIGLHEKLTRSGCHIPIIFLTGHGDIDMGVQAMKKGAVDFLTKPCDDGVLLTAVHDAMEKIREADADFREKREIQRRFGLLTTRENEIFRHIISGKLNKQIAGRLGITEATVKLHRSHIIEKLHAGSIVELVRLAQKAGVEPLI